MLFNDLMSERPETEVLSAEKVTQINSLEQLTAVAKYRQDSLNELDLDGNSLAEAGEELLAELNEATHRLCFGKQVVAHGIYLDQDMNDFRVPPAYFAQQGSTEGIHSGLGYHIERYRVLSDEDAESEPSSIVRLEVGHRIFYGVKTVRNLMQHGDIPCYRFAPVDSTTVELLDDIRLASANEIATRLGSSDIAIKSILKILELPEIRPHALDVALTQALRKNGRYNRMDDYVSFINNMSKTVGTAIEVDANFVIELTGNGQREMIYAPNGIAGICEGFGVARGYEYKHEKKHARPLDRPQLHLIVRNNAGIFMVSACLINTLAPEPFVLEDFESDEEKGAV